MIWALLLACGGTLPSVPPLVIPDDPPEIATVLWTCSNSRESSTLEVTTDFWTGGAELWLTVDGSYVERHPFFSIEASADGLADRLRIVLGHRADVRDVVPGSSTAFTCLDNPTGLLRVNDRAGEPADCDFVGPTEREFLWGDELPSCDSPARAPEPEPEEE